MSDTAGRASQDGEQDVARLSPLRELARAYGVATEFRDWQDEELDVPDETLRAVLTALGAEAGDDRQAAEALEAKRRAERSRPLPPVVVVREGAGGQVQAHPGGTARLVVALEDGSEREIGAGEPAEGATTYDLPDDLPLGWHRMRLAAGDGDGPAPECWLVVTPPVLGMAPELGRLWGLMLQVYALRSRRSWAVGDLADLRELVQWSGAELGAGFTLVNPLHAADPVPPMQPSPYLPSSRRFVNPIYLRVEEVPEFAYLAADARAAADAAGQEQRAHDLTAALLDRDAVWAAKLPVLEQVHRVPLGPGRRAAYDAFVAREGSGLTDFATWCALAERHGLPWQDWPAELRDPSSPEVAAARDELADRVDLHRWLQWQLDEQLKDVQRSAAEAGMPLGIVHDLAVGVSGTGADAWSLGDTVVSGISVGAPPDAFNQQGQNWSQPPWHPTKLADAGYLPYRDMLRTVLRHAGGIRIDHVVGLFRLWWVPDGSGPDQGAYVHYDHEALIGILVLEAQRAGAVVVGEDLGNVEPSARTYLAERGVLGTSILWFERDEDGPVDAERWRELCLATVTVHDLPPTAGYLAGEHIALRDQLGVLTRPVEEEREVDEAQRGELLDLLRRRGLLQPGADEQETVQALYAFVARTPARLVGVAVPDLVGDRRTVNQPGTDQEYPNWRVPTSHGDGRPLLLEDLAVSLRARDLVRAVAPGGEVGVDRRDVQPATSPAGGAA